MVALTTVSQNLQLALTTCSDFSSYLNTQSKKAYVNCHISAPEIEDDDRKPIDLVVVLDCSPSMAGEKLELCKTTLVILLKELKDNDRFSLVTFGSSVQTIIPLTQLDGSSRARITAAVRALDVEGCTNLSGGILTGMQEIQQSTRSDGGAPHEIKSVLVLTDGHANVGLTTIESIARMLEGSLLPNVSLFTFGYGRDHNSAMLKEISDIGRGMYYFVEDLEGVAVAFADCLGGLMSVVAQSIKLECKSLNGVKIKSVETKKPIRMIEQEHIFEVEMGDLYAEEVRDVILEVEMPAIPTEDDQFGMVEFRLRYANTLKYSLEELSESTVVRRMKKLGNDRTANLRVVNQKNRIMATKAIENAKHQADKGQFEEGRKNLQRAIDAIKLENNRAFGIEATPSDDEDNCENLLNDLMECQKLMEDSFAYQFGGQHHITRTVQMYGNQRSNFSGLGCEFGSSKSHTQTPRVDRNGVVFTSGPFARNFNMSASSPFGFGSSANRDGSTNNLFGSSSNMSASSSFGFGSSFNTPSSTGFNFGASSNPTASFSDTFGGSVCKMDDTIQSGFGSSTNTSSSTNGLFGSSSNSTVSSPFGFGSSANTNVPTNSGFGSSSNSTTSSFGFGSNAKTKVSSNITFGSSFTTSTSVPTPFGMPSNANVSASSPFGATSNTSGSASNSLSSNVEPQKMEINSAKIVAKAGAFAGKKKKKVIESMLAALNSSHLA